MRLSSVVSSLAALGARDNVEPRANIGEVGTHQTGGNRITITHQPILIARVDPLDSSGEVASHVYTIFGASNFRSYINHPDEQSRASCTSAGPQSDKSNYWVPTLYFKYPDGTMEPLISHARIFYIGNDEDKAYTTPFPRGMRIRSGTPNTRHSPDMRSAFLRMECNWQGLPSIVTTPFLPNGTNAPQGCQGISIGVQFPSCGLANQALDSDDHFSHMTWPIVTGGGQGWFHTDGQLCPPTHPIKYPGMFMQFNTYLNDRMKASGWGPENLILSNGDTLGSSFHANFVSGWDEDVLHEAINTCKTGDAHERCPALAKSLVNNHICVHEGMQPDENVGLFEPIRQLPGANCRWGAEMGGQKPTNCASTPAPGWTLPNLLWLNPSPAQALPIPARIPLDQDMTQTALTARYGPKAAGFHPFFRSCSDIIGNGGKENIRNRAGLRCGSNQDIINNLHLATAVNDMEDISPVMEESCEFVDRFSAFRVGTEAWRIHPDDTIPNDDCWTAQNICQSNSDNVRGVA